MSELPMLESGKQEIEIIKGRIQEKARSDRPVEIVEAGCGRFWPITLDGFRHYITGVDLDETALALRQQRYNDLHRVVIGDLRTVPLEKARYDVVYSAYVLEHIQDAEQALMNFSSWLKPSGLLILRIPDRDTVYGFVTRITPFWFHVFFAKYIAKYRNAGQSGFGPYPTVYDKIVSRKGINDFCEKNNLRILEEYGGSFHVLDRAGIVYALMRTFVRLVSILSLGSLPWRHNSLTYVLEKV